MKKKLKQKKLKISKQHKKLVTTILILLILVNAGLITSEFIKNETVEETQVAASFSNTPGISYQVYLKPNALYHETVQPEGTGHFSSLIDHIEVTFDNQYQGVDGAEYKGDYAITGEIIGLEAGAEGIVPAWTKHFNVSPKKTFQTAEEKLTLSQKANIDYNHFNAFITEVVELTGYNTSCIMNVIMTVNYTITTEEGEVTGSLQPSLTIPLGESYFKIAKSGVEEMKSDITRTVEVPVPVDYTKVSLFSAISCLFIIVLLILFISSVEPTPADIQRKRIRKLLKSHGSRIVAVEKGLIYGNIDACYVHSMDDIVKISDEIERPIFYVYRDDPAEIQEFFIIDREKAYIYKTNNFVVPDDSPEQNDRNSKIAS